MVSISTSPLLHHSLLIMMLIGVDVRALATLHLIIASFLVIICSLDPLNVNPLCLNPVPKPSIVGLLTLFMSLAGSEIFFLNFELRCPIRKATLVHCDNVSAIYLSGNPVQHQRTKHIVMDIHFVHEKVTRGEVHVLHVPSRYQIAKSVLKNFRAYFLMIFGTV